MYKCEILADSMNPQGDRITTFRLTYPRIIHAELMTHRMFSRNSASSRAVPFKKMVEMVKENPFIPTAWQKDHKGMQGTEYITDKENIQTCIEDWLVARNSAIESAKTLNKGFNRKDEQGNWIQTEEIDFTDKVTKQLCNRLLEPFMWHTVLVTATEYDNFFELRCPKYEIVRGDGSKEYYKSRKDIIKNHPDWIVNEDLKHINKSQADIHIQAIAEMMWDAYNESTPKKLEVGEWHIPFGDNIQLTYTDYDSKGIITNEGVIKKVKIATARCARISYQTLGDNPKIDYEADIKLHDQLIGPPFHASPFEHCARAMSNEEYYSSVKGKVPTQVDEYGITNLEMMPYSSGDPIVGFKGYNPNNGTRYGWCNNFKGFIQYRYLIENK